jgi:hypothetical protein
MGLRGVASASVRDSFGEAENRDNRRWLAAVVAHRVDGGLPSRENHE